MTTVAATGRTPPWVPCRLADGVELVGEYQGSGRTETPYLVRLATGQMLEVSPLLHIVAAELAHDRDPDAVVAGVRARSGRSISSESVAYLIDHKLRPLGIVTSPGGGPAPNRAPVLGLALHAGVLPSRLVGAVTRVLRPAFLPPVVVAVLAALVVVECWLLLGPGYGPGLEAMLVRPGQLLTVIGVTLLAGAFHELGHATASRYGGAKPGVIGAGIYLIWPVFYNDLNDSYRLSRGGRLRADLGGVYFNAIVILVLAGAYTLTGSGPLLVAIVLQHLAVLQQFVPFLRLDGYYIVSDLAGVPDLFRHIRPILSSLVPGRPPATSLTALRPDARAVVTGWVLLSVPLLATCLLLLITSLPRLITSACTSATLQAELLVGSILAAAPGAALFSGLQLLILAVPGVGLGIALARGLERCWRSARTCLDSPAPTRHWQIASPEVSTVLLRLLLVLGILQAVTIWSLLST